jgi:hypothetical protein
MKVTAPAPPASDLKLSLVEHDVASIVRAGRNASKR